MTYITIRVDEELKRDMSKHKDINWSEVIRQTIHTRSIYENLRLSGERKINARKLVSAVRDQNKLSGKISKEWSGTEEIRKWRDAR